MSLLCFPSVAPQNHSSKHRTYEQRFLFETQFFFLSSLLEFPKRNLNVTGFSNSQSKCSLRECSTQLSPVFTTSISEASNCSEGLEFRDSSQEVQAPRAPAAPQAQVPGRMAKAPRHMLPKLVQLKPHPKSHTQRRGPCSKAVRKPQRLIDLVSTLEV